MRGKASCKKLSHATNTMILIAAVDKNWGIGYKGELLCRVSDDLKNFRALTTGKTVILGSKTLATFPNGRPLPKRRNIIMSRRDDFSPEGAEVAHSAEELLALVGDDDAVVIGGESIYRLLLPYCDTAVITKFDAEFVSDASIPNLDLDPEWRLAEVGEDRFSAEGDSLVGMKYNFCTYRRK